MSKLDKTYKWQGRVDSEDGMQGLRWHQKISQQNDHSSISLVGFNCDLGVHINKGRVGAKLGPNAIRNSLANMAWHGDIHVKDAGNIEACDSLPKTQLNYANAIAEQLTNHAFVIGLGGGHEIAWGSYQGLYHALKPNSEKNIGVINFDAHFDLRKPSPLASSGTPFRQIAEHCNSQGLPFHYACIGVSEAANTQALFEYAKHSNTRYLLDKYTDVEAVQDLLIPMLKEVDELYVTVCLDVFPAHIAPGVSAPSSLGISPNVVIEIIHWLTQVKDTYEFKWRLMDIAEMNPQFDIDSRTAKLAARLVFESVKAKQIV